MAKFKVSYTVTVTFSGERTFDAQDAQEADDKFEKMANNSIEGLIIHDHVRVFAANDLGVGVQVESDWIEEV